MRKIGAIILIFLLLCGCSSVNSGYDQALKLRTSLLSGQGCSFCAQITADFSDATYTFTLDCQIDENGDLAFTVQEPETIAGITGYIAGDTGKLTFEDSALTFPLLGDGILSPVSGPWVLIQALRSGFVRYCGPEDGLFRMTVDDSYETDALTVDIWVDGEAGPVRADIYQENQRIMAIVVTNFQFQ